MQLQKEVSKEAPSKVRINVTVDKDDVNIFREKVIEDYQKNAKLPGFRKGKIPRQIILTRFSDSIKSETIQNILYESIDQILKESDYAPISDPVIIDVGELTPDKNFSFKAEFDVMPEIEIKNYRGIKGTKYEYELTEEIVNNELEALRERFSTLVSTDKPAETGNYLVIDYVEYNENGEERNRQLNQTILLDREDNSFVKQLLGVKKGDEKDITLTFENDEDGKKISRQLKVHVNVKDVKIKELPPLDDDLAQDISDVSTLKELKAKIRKDLEAEASERGEEKTKEALMTTLIENSAIDLPESMINQEIERIITNIAHTYRIDLEKLKADKERYEEYRKNIRPRAENNIKYELILSEIAKKEDIKITDEEIDEEIKRYALETKKDFETLKKNMIENKSVENLRYHLTLKKALNLVYNEAEFEKTEKLTFEEEKEGGSK